MKNDFKERMEAECNDDDFKKSYLLKRFHTDYKGNESKVLYCFFEGIEEISFYRDIINYAFPISQYTVYTYVCLGIDFVFTCYKYIKKQVFFSDKKNIIFFADKDVEDLININRPKDSNIIRTEYYSIENYVVNEFVLERILMEFFFIDEYNVYSNIITKFKTAVHFFLNQMKRLAMLIIKNKESDNDGDWAAFNFSDIFQINDELEITLKEHITIEKNGIEINFTNLDDYYSRNLKITILNIEDIETRIEQTYSKLSNEELFSDEKVNPMYYIRGHYVFEFFRHFILKIGQYIKTKELNSARKKSAYPENDEIKKAITDIDIEIEKEIDEESKSRFKEVKRLLTRNVHTIPESFPDINISFYGVLKTMPSMKDRFYFAMFAPRAIFLEKEEIQYFIKKLEVLKNGN